LCTVGVINEAGCLEKGVPGSRSTRLALWSAIAVIQRRSSVGTIIARNAKWGGSGSVSTSFHSVIASGGHLDHRRRVGDIDADLRHLRPGPSRGHRATSGSALRDRMHPPPDRRRASQTPRAVDKLDAAHAGAADGWHDPDHPACRPQHDVRDRPRPRRRSTSSISGRVAHSIEIPKSRLGGRRPPGARIGRLSQTRPGQRRLQRDRS